jgi:hypothetical protein
MPEEKKEITIEIKHPELIVSLVATKLKFLDYYFISLI